MKGGTGASSTAQLINNGVRANTCDYFTHHSLSLFFLHAHPSQRLAEPWFRVLEVFLTSALEHTRVEESRPLWKCMLGACTAATQDAASVSKPYLTKLLGLLWMMTRHRRCKRVPEDVGDQIFAFLKVS
jgi:hypothetical protein